MMPVLFEFMQWQVKSYSAAIFLAALVCTSLAIALRPRDLLTLNQILDICLIAFLGALVGARGAGMLIYDGLTIENMLAVFQFWKRSTLASVGIPLVVIPALVLYLNLKKLHPGRVVDYMIPFALLAVGIQRCLGCFFAGCCYGKATDSFFGVVMGGSGLRMAVHPTQLYLGLPMFFFALLLYNLRFALAGGKTLAATALFCLTNLVVQPYRAGGTFAALGGKYYLGGLILSIGGIVFLWRRRERLMRMERTVAKVGAGVLAALFVLAGPSYGTRLEYELSRNEVKWGEPITITVRSENPLQRTVQGGITLSFSSRVIVVEQDYGVSKLHYEGDPVMKAGEKKTIPVRNIMVENWYRSWGPRSLKTMRVTFFPLKTGVLRITIRAAFFVSVRDYIVRNVPSHSECYDQQGYPAQCRHVFVKGGDDIIENLRSVVNSVGIIGDDEEFLRHLQALIDNPDNRAALQHLGISQVGSSAQYFEKYLEMFRSRMADPEIRDSPRFFEMFRRLINDSSDGEARIFFKLPINSGQVLSARELARQKYINECEDYLTEVSGGAALLSLIGAEGDIYFDGRYGGSRGDIVIAHEGLIYSFKKDSRIVFRMIDKIMEIKPRSKYIYEPDPVSDYSFQSLRKEIERHR